MENIFVDHNVDPSQKNGEWILKGCKNIFKDCESGPAKIFYRQRAAYDKNDSYFLGTQSINKYKPHQGIDPGSNKTNRVIDWTPRMVMAKPIDIVESKINGRGYYVSCTPVDAAAKSAADNYFAKIRTKIMAREIARQNGMDPDQYPALMREAGEPADLEELKMQMEYSYTFNLAMEAEMGIALIQQQNDFDKIRRDYITSIVRYGVGVVKEDVNPDGDIIIRNCHPRDMVVSECKRRDFSDKRYVGEFSSVPLSQIAGYFEDEALQRICETAKDLDGKFIGKGRSFTNRDGFNAIVMDIEFKSWNKKSWRQSYTRFGNLVVTPEKMYVTKDKDKNFIHGDRELPRYITQTKEVIYKAKWVVGTDYIYDYGIAKNQKRSAPNRAITDFSYHIYAPSYADGQAVSMVDRCIPIVDEYQNTVYKIQNFKSLWIPYVIDIDFSAIEQIPLGQGGNNLTPDQVIKLMFDKHILANRRVDKAGQSVNYKAIDIIPTGMHQEFNVLVGDLARCLNELRDTIGLNELTDATTPNSNTLNGVAAIGVEATNNALKPLMDGDRYLVESSAQGIIRRLVTVVKNKKVAGMVSALGDNSMRFFELTPDIAMHDWGIKLQVVPTQAEREAFMMKLKLADANGQINPSDYVIIMNCTNLKQAAVMLSYSLSKKQKEAAMQANQQIMINAQAQQDSARVTAEQARETIELTHTLKMDEIRLKGNIDKEIASIKANSAESVSQVSNTTKLTGDILKSAQSVNNMQQSF